MANDFPSAEFSTSDKETMLYIDQAIAFTMVGQVWNNAKVEGNIAMPEAYLTTYLLPSVSQDSVTGEWYTTLPQPPVSLPLGYSITDIYPTVDGTRGNSFLPIKSKRTAYRNYMPRPSGGFYRVTNGSRVILGTDTGSSLSDYTFYAEMAKTRTESLSETMVMPDDAIEMVFQNVVQKMKDRMQIPQDIIKDDLPAGNKAS